MSSTIAFKDRINHRKRDIFEDTKIHVGCLKKNGEYSYREFGGFTGKVHFPVKVRAEGYTYDYPNYIEVKTGLLLGSWVKGVVYIVMPFQEIE